VAGAEDTERELIEMTRKWQAARDEIEQLEAIIKVCRDSDLICLLSF
jgi:hypothetical protein